MGEFDRSKGIRLEHVHSWAVTPAEAVAIQRELLRYVVTENALDEVRTVAGVDVSAKGEIGRAAVVVLSYPGLDFLESHVAEMPLQMPYIPGLLSFRETPAVLKALEGLERLPDLLILDGQGLAHPRRMGIATHLGVLLDHPTIGCAKSRLWGQHEDPGPQRGDWAPLRDGDEVIGAVLRTRTGVKPVYVSIGHKVDLQAAVDYVLGCCTRFKLPETTRWAHRVAGCWHGDQAIQSRKTCN